MNKKAISTLLVALAMVLAVTAVFLHQNKKTDPSIKYSEYTLEHSLTKKYTASDYEKSQKLIDAICIDVGEYNATDEQKVKELLNTPIDLNCPNMRKRRGLVSAQVPLSWVCHFGKNEIATELIKKGATAKHIKGTTAPISSVVYSYEEDDLELIKLLLKNGADVNEYEKGEYSPIIELSSIGFIWREQDLKREKGILKIFKLFEKNGASIYDLGYYKSSVLQEAVLSNNFLLVKYLIKEKKMDSDYQNEGGFTALMYAARYSETTRIVRYLLEQGANPAIVDKDGDTALDIAIIMGVQENIDLLSK